MKTSVRLSVFLLLALVGCSPVPFGIHWCNAELELESGLKTGIFLSPIIPETFFLGIFACFLIILASAWLVGLRLSLIAFIGVCGMAVFCGIAADFFSVSVGRHISEHFLDGFGERVAASGIESNAVEWANQVFADRSLNPKGSEEIYLAPDKVPSFFTPIFDKAVLRDAEVPEAIVYYGKDKTSAEQIEIRMSYGVDWGIIILKDPNVQQEWQFKPKPRRCGKRFFVYLYYYK
jgi:hypothetical protein